MQRALWSSAALLRPPRSRQPRTSSGIAMADTTPVKRVRSADANGARAAPAVAMDTQQLVKTQRIALQLQGLYPNPPIPLDHSSHFQLLVAVIMSAQSTDKKVGAVVRDRMRSALPAARCCKRRNLRRQIRPPGHRPPLLSPSPLAPTSNPTQPNVCRSTRSRPSSSGPPPTRTPCRSCPCIRSSG
jgi:hypothetical protein